MWVLLTWIAVFPTFEEGQHIQKSQSCLVQGSEWKTSWVIISFFVLSFASLYEISHNNNKMGICGPWQNLIHSPSLLHSLLPLSPYASWPRSILIEPCFPLNYYYPVNFKLGNSFLNHFIQSLKPKGTTPLTYPHWNQSLVTVSFANPISSSCRTLPPASDADANLQPPTTFYQQFFIVLWGFLF